MRRFKGRSTRLLLAMTFLGICRISSATSQTLEIEYGRKMQDAITSGDLFAVKNLVGNSFIDPGGYIDGNGVSHSFVLQAARQCNIDALNALLATGLTPEHIFKFAKGSSGTVVGAPYTKDCPTAVSDAIATITIHKHLWDVDVPTIPFSLFVSLNGALRLARQHPDQYLINECRVKTIILLASRNGYPMTDVLKPRFSWVQLFDGIPSDLLPELAVYESSYIWGDLYDTTGKFDPYPTPEQLEGKDAPASPTDVTMLPPKPTTKSTEDPDGGYKLSDCG